MIQFTKTQKTYWKIKIVKEKSKKSSQKTDQLKNKPNNKTLHNKGMLSCSPEDSPSYVDFLERLQRSTSSGNGVGTGSVIQRESNSNSPFDLKETNLRRTQSWAPDDAVSHCHNCHRSFTLFYRKHHCRACGRIFCSYCSAQTACLPKDFDSFPKSPNSSEWLYAYVGRWRTQNQPQRVCDACKIKITQLVNVSSAVRMLIALRLDLRELCVWACVSKQYHDAVEAIRGMHWNLLYRLPWYKLSRPETEFIHLNSEFFCGHNRWLTLLIKTTDYSNLSQVEALLNLLKTPRFVSCCQTHCPRDCKPQLTWEDAVELIALNLPNSSIRQVLLNTIAGGSDLQFECAVPLLIFELRHESPSVWVLPAPHQSILGLLNNRSNHSITIRTSVYWNLVVMRNRGTIYRQAYEGFMLHLHNTLGQTVVWDELIRGRNIVKSIERMPDASQTSEADLKAYFRSAFESMSFQFNHSSRSTQEDTSNDCDLLLSEFEGEQCKDRISILPTVLPCSTGFVADTVDIERLRVKQSATSPVVVSFLQESVRFELLYKRECLLKDQIALNVIRLMDEILKRELGVDLHIVTYRVLPTAQDAGLVEIIPNSETIHSILHQHKFTLQNWILEKTGHLTVNQVRDNFVKSTAAYCVISYLLAVGDRHLDNIMVTETGYLFHIDYSFFMGFDPKPMAPYMRITQDIVDALGGVDSKDYGQFKEYCSKAYNCLRSYTNLFATLLRLITEDGLALDQGCFTRARLEEELLHRFVPGESVVEAELQLLNRLEDSFRSSTPQFCIDFWHYHSRESKLTQTLSKIPTWGFTSIWPFKQKS